MKGVMIQGCTSDAGKSYVATALCRALKNRGYSVCPYKSQNMANNSYVTWDGKEIGRSQGVQAEAAGLRGETYMNPILLKPQKDLGAEIVLFGEVYRSLPGESYGRDFAMDKGLKAAREGLKIIREKYDVIVAEGAGSPAEVNLNDREIVNMRIANEADLPVLLVVDINRGGAFASVVGTLELLGKDRERVKGIIINQFYGDVAYFGDGVRWLEEYTGVKVCGILPHLEGVHLEGEDSLSVDYYHRNGGTNGLRIGVAELPFVSNYTDMEIFRCEPDLSVFPVNAENGPEGLDAVILPGTKSTIGDLRYLEKTGLAEKLKDFPGYIFGICGGYQIMGEELIDEEGVDLKPGTKAKGLSLLPLTTEFHASKRVTQSEGKGIHPLTEGLTVNGYEIHMGRSERTGETALPLWSVDGADEGLATADLRRGGSYLHNIFHNDEFRTMWLNLLRKEKGLPLGNVIDTAAAKEEQYEALAAHVEKHLDMDYIIDLIESGSME